MSTFHAEYMKGVLKRGIIIFFSAGLVSITIYSLVGNAVSESPKQNNSGWTRFENKTTEVLVDDTSTDIAILPDEDIVISEGENKSEALEDMSEVGGQMSDVELETITNDLVAFSILSQTGEIILDLRDEDDYNEGHIRTSKHYDLKYFKADEFSEDQEYIFICEDGICKNALELASKIEDKVKSIVVLEKGFVFWEEDGFRVVKD